MGHRSYFPLHIFIVILFALSYTVSTASSESLDQNRIQQTALVPTHTVVFHTPTSVPTMTPSPTPSVSQQDILAVYKDLVQANQDTMAAAHNTLNVVMTLVSIATALIFGAGIFSIVKVQGVVQKAAHAEKRVKELEEKINSDTKILDQLHTRHSVDQYAMRLFSNVAKESIGAKKELLQLSKHSDPIIRRECLHVFGVMPNLMSNWWDNNVFRRIEEMAATDMEGGVRCEAQFTIDHWMTERNRTQVG